MPVMNTIPITFRPSRFIRGLALAAVVLLLLPSALPAAGSKPEADQSDNAQEHVSTFSLPRTLNQGRDPFFPSSTRVIAVAHPQRTKVPSGPAKLELKGISGTPDRPLAIINNRTLGVGEEQDVTTTDGRVRVLCLAIEGTKVRIRAQGQTRELMLRKGI